MSLKQILLVEDSIDDIEFVKLALEASNIKNDIHITQDGEEALDFFHKRNGFKNVPDPDLVLLDINLPKKNGFEVLEEVKQDPKLQKTPIVALTTSHTQKDVSKVYELRGNCYVTKPADVEEFINVINSISTFWLKVAKLPSDT